MKSTQWEQMSSEEQAEELKDCRQADALELEERRAGYGSDSYYDPD